MLNWIMICSFSPSQLWFDVWCSRLGPCFHKAFENGHIKVDKAIIENGRLKMHTRSLDQISHKNFESQLLCVGILFITPPFYNSGIEKRVVQSGTYFALGDGHAILKMRQEHWPYMTIKRKTSLKSLNKLPFLPVKMDLGGEKVFRRQCAWMSRWLIRHCARLSRLLRLLWLSRLSLCPIVTIVTPLSDHGRRCKHAPQILLRRVYVL